MQNELEGSVILQNSCLADGAVSIGQDVVAVAMIADEVGDDVACGEGIFEDFTGEEAPVVREGQVGVAYGLEVAGDGEEKEFSFGREINCGRPQQAGGRVRFGDVELLGIGFAIVIQADADVVLFIQMSLYTAGIDPPIHNETVGGDACIEGVAHLAVFFAVVGVADRAETTNVEIGVWAEQGVVSPGNQVDALLAHHLPLRFFEREADALAAMVRMHAQLMRAVFEQASLRGVVKAGEAEGQSDYFIAFKGAEGQPAVMYKGDEDVRRDYIGGTAVPDFFGKFLDAKHFFVFFEQANGVRGHGISLLKNSL